MEQRGLDIREDSVDLIFTDPPYDEASVSLFGVLAKLAQQILKPGGSMVTYFGHYALFEIGKLIADNSQLKYHWLIVVKHNGHGARMRKQKVWPKYKPLLWYYKPKEGQTGPTMFSDIEDMIESEPVDKNLHDWQQSSIEARRIIETLTVEGQTVLDPFMGAGTTGISSLQANRRFIGIEINKDYFQIAKARLINFKPEVRVIANSNSKVNYNRVGNGEDDLVDHHGLRT
jgi:16S rRNA G966 N2-methylase RsmD